MLRGWDEGFDIPSLGIAIHPEYQRMGAGRVLMHFLHLAARHKGAKRVRLKYDLANKRVRQFYESFGYLFSSEDQLENLGHLDLPE